MTHFLIFRTSLAKISANIYDFGTETNSQTVSKSSIEEMSLFPLLRENFVIVTYGARSPNLTGEKNINIFMKIE